MKLSRIVTAVLAILTTLTAIALWQLQTNGDHSIYYPSPVTIAREFQNVWLFDRFWSDFVPSVLRMTAGFFVGCGLGYTLGIALALGPAPLRNAANPIIEFVRAVPPPAFLPFAIVLLGIGDVEKVFIVALGCMFPVLLNTMDGVREVEPLLYDVCASYDVRRPRDVVRGVVLPASMPRAFAGLQTSLAVALILMVISEMYASVNGVGRFILEAQRTFAIRSMWSGIVLLGLLGITLNAILRAVEARTLRWHRGAHGSGTV